MAVYGNSKQCDIHAATGRVVTLAERLLLSESDLAAGSAVPGRSQRGERKRRRDAGGADSAGMVSRNRCGQMGQYRSAGGQRISWWGNVGRSHVTRMYIVYNTWQLQYTWASCWFSADED
ncbi:Hypothetical predicted protein [Xyrichtys novacula]|uniref:Uncharacterized protein n=1 Tax=Xyrichtys novacula TaxID=13765 RepID=A0AAV1EWH9_XYRNO|nr:Hypothetical predicted protein [Xyrichtys novacula]